MKSYSKKNKILIDKKQNVWYNIGTTNESVGVNIMKVVILAKNGSVIINKIDEKTINLLNNLYAIGAFDIHETEVHYFLEN